MTDLTDSAKFIDVEVAALRTRLMAVFFANMDKYGIVVTGRLKSSTKIDTNSVSDDLVGGLEIVVQKYGLILQSKKQFVVKAPIADIMAWIKAIGLSRFKQDGVWWKEEKMPTEDIAIRRLAWGIKQQGRAKKLGTDSLINSKSNTRKSDPWFYRDFFKEVKVFQTNLAAHIPEAMAKDVARAITRQLLAR